MRDFWRLVVPGVLFALAHTQSPLYYSNQNQYFLHGLAAAGLGDLKNDWLANTKDPTPAFSLLIELAQRCRCIELFSQGMFFLALVVYFVCLADLVHRLFGPIHLPAWSVLFTLLHSGFVRSLSYQWLGEDYPWFFNSGLANQYILGTGLQPSVVGVGLLVALNLYHRGYITWAVLFAAGLNNLHSTYLLGSALIITGILIAYTRETGWRKAGGLGLLAVLCVCPVLAYNLWTFQPVNAGDFASAQAIIAWERIPHHTDPNRWLDICGVCQILGLAASVYFLRPTRLFAVVGIASLGMLGLSLLAYFTHHATLSLFFPWRLSAVFIPLVTAILCAKVVHMIFPLKQQNIPLRAWPAWLALVLLAVSGIAVYALGWGYREVPTEDELLVYVQGNCQPGDVYMVPSRFPPPATNRGVFAATFRPAKLMTSSMFDIQRFRLATGAAVYIDFKSIPYSDEEVLEWRRRVKWVEQLHMQMSWTDEQYQEVREVGISHVVWPTVKPSPHPGLRLVFTGTGYSLYTVGNR
jgi:hypothetical protein